MLVVPNLLPLVLLIVLSVWKMVLFLDLGGMRLGNWDLVKELLQKYLSHASSTFPNSPRHTSHLLLVVEFTVLSCAVRCSYEKTNRVDDGEMYLCGSGKNGLMGNGDTKNSYEPLSLYDLSPDASRKITSIAAGLDHNLVLVTTK